MNAATQEFKTRLLALMQELDVGLREETFDQRFGGKLTGVMVFRSTDSSIVLPITELMR